MALSFAFINNNEQLFIHGFDQDGQAFNKRLDAQDIEDHSFNMLFLSEDASSDMALEKSKFIPVRRASDFHLTEENFQELGTDQIQKIYENAQSTWTLSNNISLLNEFFAVIDHLRALYPNQRTTFFEELWYVLKRNIGAFELKIIFNDIIKAKKEGQKDQLVQNFVGGETLPEVERGSEIEEKLMENYKAHFAESFEICEFNQEKNELVISANIKGSPVLIMAKAANLTKIQNGILKTLFEGLNR